jgi:hypothetical protein
MKESIVAIAVYQRYDEPISDLVGEGRDYILLAIVRRSDVAKKRESL